MFACRWMRIRNGLYLMFPLIMSAALSARAETRYVALEGMSIAPYTNWPTAATHIQDAVAVATDGDTILVAPGCYPLSGSAITVSNAVHIKSTQGASQTIIDGVQSSRCFTLIRSSATISGFTITGGARREDGGGILIDHGGTVENCIVRNNATTPSTGGGGLYCKGGGAVIRNCVIYGNSTTGKYGGGGVLLYDGGNVVENCTVVSNFSSGTGGGLSSAWGSDTIRNCILYGNSAQSQTDFTSNGPDDQLLNCCVTPKPTQGANNISGNPQLTGYFSLNATSPCIDAGTNMGWMATVTDIEGHPRIFNTHVDIGASEAAPVSLGITCTNPVATAWQVPVGARVQLQYVTNLHATNWTSLGEVETATQAQIRLVDTNALEAARFYRLRWTRP